MTESEEGAGLNQAQQEPAEKEKTIFDLAEEDADWRNLQICRLPPDWLQPRADASPLDEANVTALMESFRDNGIRTPIQVRPIPGGKYRYEIVAGRHRYEAAKRLDWQYILCIKREDDDLKAEM